MKFNIYYFVTLLFVLLACNSNFISASNPLWFTIVLFMIAVAIKKKAFSTKDIKTILIFSGVYLLFVGIRDVFINNLDVDSVMNDVIFLVKYIFLAFIYCVVMKEKLVDNIIKVTVHLSLISIFFFVLQLVGLRDILFSLPDTLGLPGATNSPDQETVNFVIFSLSKVHLYRNCGFFWEPGAYACYLVFIMVLNLFLAEFTFDRNAKILTFVIITTQSTTGYLAVLVILFLIYRYRVPKINVGVLVIIPVLAVLFLTVPVLSDKITKTYQEDIEDMSMHHLKQASKSAYYRKDKKAAIPLNRFSSMTYLDYLFGPQLILGANSRYDTLMNSLFRVDISNGIWDFFAKFGVVGFLLILYRYIKFCKAYLLTNELLTYGILIFIVDCFGEPVVSLPFILMMLFISLPQLKPVNPEIERFRRFNPPVLNDTKRI